MISFRRAWNQYNGRMRLLAYIEKPGFIPLYTSTLIAKKEERETISCTILLTKHIIWNVIFTSLSITWMYKPSIKIKFILESEKQSWKIKPKCQTTMIDCLASRLGSFTSIYKSSSLHMFGMFESELINCSPHECIFVPIFVF